MEFNLDQELAIATVISVEGLPCSIVGQKKIYSLNSDESFGILKSPWGVQFTWLEKRLEKMVREDIPNGMFRMATFINPEEPDQIFKVMITPYLPPHELVILGSGHIALQLAQVGRLLGYRITVADDRSDPVLDKTLSETDQSICCSFADVENVIHFGSRTSVVIVTRGHMHDMDCLRKVIKYPLAYLGMIGSRRKVNLVKEQLIEDGIDSKKIEQVHMPIGLDIGAQTPAEIAVSIAAELIKVRRAGTGGTGGSLNSVSKTVEGINDCEMLSSVDRETLQKAIIAASEKRPAALATIIQSEGSTPRKAGARMLIYNDGQTYGTVGGGSGESEVRLAALDVIKREKPYIHKVSLSADIAALEGMACGGALEVFIEPVKTFINAINGGENHV